MSIADKYISGFPNEVTDAIQVVINHSNTQGQGVDKIITVENFVNFLNSEINGIGTIERTEDLDEGFQNRPLIYVEEIDGFVRWDEAEGKYVQVGEKAIFRAGLVSKSLYVHNILVG